MQMLDPNKGVDVKQNGTIAVVGLLMRVPQPFLKPEPEEYVVRNPPLGHVLLVRNRIVIFLCLLQECCTALSKCHGLI